MNQTSLILVLSIALISCGKNHYNNYGAIISSNVDQSYRDVFNKIQSGPVENVTLKGEIINTCPKKGCWMDVKVSETDTIIVRFKDYGFFVPKKGAEGKQTIINGEAKLDTLSVELLRHYAEDAGKPTEEILAITEPEFKMQFTASGVLIEK